MTFEQWWKNKKYYARFLDGVCKISVNDCGDIARDAWEAAQPKWTLCKDGMPTEDGNYLVAVLLPYGHRTVLSSDYNANNCDFWEIDPDREIIAWMPLPEAPNVHDD